MAVYAASNWPSSDGKLVTNNTDSLFMGDQPFLRLLYKFIPVERHTGRTQFNRTSFTRETDHMLGLKRHQILMLAVLVSGTFITILNQTVVSPALPSIMEEMKVSAATAQWLTTGFTMVNAVMIPITAYLTDRFTIRRLFLIAMSIFLVGTLLAAWAPMFVVILAGRLIQAMGAGVLMPMVMTVLLLTFPVERRGTAMGIFNVIIAFGPSFGPVVAGLIIDRASWHIIFLAVAICVFIVIIGAFFFLKTGPANNPNMEGIDKPSVVMSTLGFGGMLYGFSAIGNSGFSVEAGIAVVFGLIVTILFFRRQLSMEKPMLQIRVLKTPRFALGTGVSMMVQGATMANAVLIPIYVQTICGYSATVSALITLPGAMMMGVVGLVSGPLFDKYGPRALVITGLSLLTVGTILMSLLDTTSSMVYVACVMCGRFMGMSMVNMPITTWGMNALDNRVINHGNAVNNTLRQVAGSLGTALVISAYSLFSGAHTSMMTTQSQMAGMNFAFAIQAVAIAATLILAIVKVKEDKAASKQ